MAGGVLLPSAEFFNGGPGSLDFLMIRHHSQLDISQLRGQALPPVGQFPATAVQLLQLGLHRGFFLSGGGRLGRGFCGRPAAFLRPGGQ